MLLEEVLVEWFVAQRCVAGVTLRLVPAQHGPPRLGVSLQALRALVPFGRAWTWSGRSSLFHRVRVALVAPVRLTASIVYKMEFILDMKSSRGGRCKCCELHNRMLPSVAPLHLFLELVLTVAGLTPVPATGCTL